MATIIKLEGDQKASNGCAELPTSFSFGGLADQADHYLADVRNEAAKIVQQAKSEAEKIRKQAEEEGRLAADQAASRVLDEKVAQQMSLLRPALESAVSQLVDTRGAWLEHWQHSAVQLAAEMAERLVRRELETRPEVTLEWIREALELAAGAVDVVLHVHPADIEDLGNQIQQVTESFAGLSPARIAADAAVSRGGCVVRTRFGGIDQQIRSQLDRLIAELS